MKQTKSVAMEDIENTEQIPKRIQKLKSSDDEIIPLHKVKSACLKKLMTWCNFHKNDPIRNKNIPISMEERKKEKRMDINAWDAEFLEVEDSELYSMMRAAHYLELDGLSEVAAKEVAGRMKGKGKEQLRKMFDMEDMEKQRREVMPL